MLGLCGMGGSSGMSSGNLSSLLLNASVLHDRSLIFLGRQLNNLGPMVLKLFAWIVLILWDTQSIDFLTQVTHLVYSPGWLPLSVTSHIKTR